jgi:predicted permease
MQASLLLVIPLGNSSFFGFPMIEALIGKDAIKYAIIYDQLGSFLFLAIYAAIIVAIYSGQQVNLVSILKRVFTFVPFITLIVSLVVGEVSYIEPILEPLSHMLTPLAMISVGYMLRIGFDFSKRVFAITLFVKLLAIPLVIFVGFKAIGIGDSLAIRASLLESAMPTMITAGAIATMSGFAPKFSNAIVGYGIILAFITVPIFNYLY